LRERVARIAGRVRGLSNVKRRDGRSAVAAFFVGATPHPSPFGDTFSRKGRRVLVAYFPALTAGP